MRPNIQNKYMPERPEQPKPPVLSDADLNAIAEGQIQPMEDRIQGALAAIAVQPEADRESRGATPAEGVTGIQGHDVHGRGQNMGGSREQKVLTGRRRGAGRAPSVSVQPMAALSQPSPEQSVSGEAAAEIRGEVLAKLDEQRLYWLSRLDEVSDQRAFSSLTSEAGAGGKWVAETGPLFIAGNVFLRFVRESGLTAPDIEALRMDAWRMEEEIRSLYRAKRAELYPEKNPPAGAPLDTLLSQAENKGDGKEGKGAPKKLEAQEMPIVLGRYRDHEGALCVVTEADGVYSYTYLEGAERGNVFTQPDEKRMRHLIADDWQKVADDAMPEATPPKLVSPEPVAAPIVEAVAVTTPDIPSRPDTEEKSSHWTQRKLFATINDGDTFTVVDKSGKETEYQRKGSKITKKKGSAKEQKAGIVIILNKGGHIKGMEAVAATPAVASPDAVTIAAGEAPVTDATFTPGSFLEGKASCVYTNKDGKLVKVERRGDEYAVFGGAHNLQKTASEEEIRKWGEEEGWESKDGSVTVPGTAEAAMPIEQREVLKPFLPEDGKVYQFTAKKVIGSYSVVRKSDGYHFLNTLGKEFKDYIGKELGISAPTVAEQEAWIHDTADKEGWQLTAIDGVEQREALKLFLPEEGVVYHFESKKRPGNSNALVRRSDGYHFFDYSGKELEVGRGELAEQEEWIRKIAKQEGWWLTAIDSVAQDEATAAAFDSAAGIGANEVTPSDAPTKDEGVKGASLDPVLGDPLGFDTTVAAPATPDAALAPQGERKEKKIGFEPLAEGARASYVSKKYGEVTVLRKDDVYYYTHGKDLSDVERMGMAVSEKQIKDIALFEEWISLNPNIPTLSTELPGVLPRSQEKNEVGVFRPLAPGEHALYTTSLGKEIQVDRDPVGDSYLVTFPGEAPFPYDLKGVEEAALQEGWKFHEASTAPKKPEALKPFLLVGETVRYFVPEIQGEYTIERTPEGYHFFNDTYRSDPCTEDEMKEIIRTAKWRRVPGSEGGPNVPKPEVAPKGWRPLDDGKESVYSYGRNVSVRVRRSGARYHHRADIVGGSDPKEGTWTERTVTDIATMAQRQGWEYVSESFFVATPPSPEPVSNKLDELRALVDAERLAFVTTDYKQSSVWQRMKDFFGPNIGKESRDQDTESARQRYTEALMRLQSAELAELKSSSLSGPEQGKVVAQMLHYYKYEERVNLFNYRNQVKMESKNLPQRAISAIEKIGREYNKLKPGQKLLIGGVCLVGGIGATIVGAGGLTAAMSGVVLIKRLVATSGFAVMVDTGVEKWQEKRALNKSDEEKGKNFNELNDLYRNDPQGEGHFNRLDALLKNDIQSLNEKFQTQKRQALYRRSAVFGTAVLGMVGMGAAYASHIGSAGVSRPDMPHQDVRQAARAARAAASAASGPDRITPGVPLPEGAAPANAAHLPRTGTSGAAAEAARPGVAVDQTRVAAPAAAEIAPSTNTLREAYTVVDTDGKRGLWGVLERRLPDDFSGDKNRAIASLENAMRAKLDAMTPAERLKIGFPGNLPDGRANLDLIRSGDTIHFEKLLTTKEIQSVLDGKTLAPSRVAEAATRVARGATTLVRPPATDMLEQLMADNGGASGRVAARLADPHFNDPLPHDPMRVVSARTANALGLPRPGLEYGDPNMRVLSARTMAAQGIPKPGLEYGDPRMRVLSARTMAANARLNPFDMQRPMPVPGVRTGAAFLGATPEPGRVATTLENIALTDPKSYLLEHPEDFGRYNSTLGRLRMGIFMMNPGEAGIPTAYDYTVNGEKLGGTNIARVLKDMDGFKAGRLSYDRLRNPLHYDQMKDLVKFVDACGKALGPQYAQVEAGENINHYTQRMATAALRTGKDIPGFFKH